VQPDGPPAQKAIHQFKKTAAFPLYSYDRRYEATCLGHRVPAHRFALHKKRPLRKRPQKPSQQYSRLGRLSQGDFNRGGTMCQHLCRIHLAPKSSASRPELIESLLYFVHGYLIEEILHIALQRILLVQRKLFDTKSCPWLPSESRTFPCFQTANLAHAPV